MVLPEPAAHSPPDKAVGWLDEIALTLRLSGGAALVLVDKARPARLGDLVRTLRHDFPEIDVIPDVGKLAGVAPGSTIVLTPSPDDAEWLNLRRGQFAELKLKVILFCEEATTTALKFRAPDFFDWIGRHSECPPGPVPFAVRGIHAAFEAEWSVAWTGSRERAAVEGAVHAACPAEQIVWLVSEAPFEELVKTMESTGVVLAEADTPQKLRRARWARAAARRNSRVVLVVGEQDAPGFWPVHDRQMPLMEACAKLAATGVRAPGQLAALVDLEPEAIELLPWALNEQKEGETADPEDPVANLVPALRRDGLVGQPTALTEAIEEPDPGAALVRLTLSSDADRAYRDSSRPALIQERSPLRFRALAVRRPVRAAFLDWLSRGMLHFTSDGADLGVAAAHTLDRRHALFMTTIQWHPRLYRNESWIEIVLRLQADRVDLLLKSAVELVILGEGDVIAWSLRSVQNADVREALLPLLPQIARERDPDALLDLLRPVVQQIRMTWRTRMARWAGVRHVLLVAAAASILGGALAAAFSRHGVWALLPAAFGAWVCLFAAGAARKRTAWSDENGERFLDDVEKRFPPTRAEREGRLRERLQVIEDKVTSEDFPAAATLAREALDAARTLQSASFQQAAAAALASISLAQGKRAYALEILEPFFGAPKTPLSKDLLALATRLLAETGRAPLAVRALVHLTGATLPAASNLRPVPDVPSEDTPLFRRLMSEPAGHLADVPDAYLTLVDSLLKQGRYPEALLVARGANTRFAGRAGKAISQLTARALDLERRIGTEQAPPRSAHQG